MSTNTDQHRPRAALGAWARANWRTTVIGLLTALAVILERLPSSPRWQDIATALVLALLGVLAVDPHKVPDAGSRTP